VTSTSIIIFGASGDLTRRKLIPALFNLYCKGMLAPGSRIVGFARRPWDDAEFRNLLDQGMQELAPDSYDPDAWPEFAAMISYVPGNLDDAGSYQMLGAHLKDIENDPANRLYYLATAPRFFGPIVSHLGQFGMAAKKGVWRHVVIEKPFGRDLASAQALNADIQEVFDEDQIYRIDHYLGKETVQNIMAFRFANTIFEPLWNRNYIDHVQITAAERVGVGHRAGYYDQAGVLRDMFQNHLLQLVALTAMEPPAAFNAKTHRDEKVKVLDAINPITIDDTIWAQYQAYREAEGVAEGSRTPTYIALKLFIDNWRWQGVPFYIRSGKALQAKTTEISLVFKRVPHLLFPDNDDLAPNSLSLCLQPDEGIHLKFETKVPGAGMRTDPVDMEFHYDTDFEGVNLPEAYERLLLDAINGDASLFTRSDGIERAWALVDLLDQAWNAPDAPALAFYQAGSWGPNEADDMMARDGRQWLVGCLD
jgi:glucose-6-phosphate 1-dehydrogenase